MGAHDVLLAAAGSENPFAWWHEVAGPTAWILAGLAVLRWPFFFTSVAVASLVWQLPSDLADQPKLAGTVMAAGVVAEWLRARRVRIRAHRTAVIPARGRSAVAASPASAVGPVEVERAGYAAAAGLVTVRDWVAEHPRLVAVPGAVVIGAQLAGPAGAGLVVLGLAVGLWWVAVRVPGAVSEAAGRRPAPTAAPGPALPPGPSPTTPAPLPTSVPVPEPGELERWGAQLMPIGIDPVTGEVRYVPVLTPPATTTTTDHSDDWRAR